MAKRKSVIGCLGIACFLLLASCQQEQKEQKESAHDPVQMMADLHCEAVELRKARFELADEMRFLQDTIISVGATEIRKEELTVRLKNLEPYKDSIVTKSLNLAKVIKFKLDSLMEQEFDLQQERDEFDTRLTSELAKRGCQ